MSESASQEIVVTDENVEELLDVQFADREDQLNKFKVYDGKIHSCFSCGNYLPQIFSGKVSEVGRCYHFAFFRAGMIKLDDETPSDLSKADVVLKELKSRPTRDQFVAKMQEGYRFSDLYDLRGASTRICADWVSGLRLAPTALAYWNDSIENHKDKHPLILKWFEDGCPTEQKTLYPQTKVNSQPHDTVIPEVPKEYLSYETCNECFFFEPQLQKSGAPEPFKGKCTKNALLAARKSNMPVLDLLETGGDIDTYSFFGCNSFARNKSRDGTKNAMAEVSPRALLFLESNPDVICTDNVGTNNAIEFVRKFCHISHIFKRQNIGDAYHKEIVEMDHIAAQRQHHKQTNFRKLEKDIGVTPISQHFAAGLKKETKDQEASWGRFRFYDDSAVDIFGDEVVEAVKHESVTDGMLNVILDKYSAIEGD